MMLRDDSIGRMASGRVRRATPHAQTNCGESYYAMYTAYMHARLGSCLRRRGLCVSACICSLCCWVPVGRIRLTCARCLRHIIRRCVAYTRERHGDARREFTTLLARASACGFL